MTPAWLTARPIAHRGLHDAALGLVENTLGAAEAAIAQNFAIECDVQLSRDGEAMVFHDFALERLTLGAGSLAAQDAAALRRLVLRGGAGHIPALPEFLAALAGRVPLICEIKSRFDGDMRLAERTLAAVQAQSGPVALKSFDPAVIAHLRNKSAGIPLGMVAEAHYVHPEWDKLSAEMKVGLAQFLHYSDTRPDFLSWHVEDLPHATPNLFRAALRLPVMAWTVRRQEQRDRAAHWADQMVFEGFAP